MSVSKGFIKDLLYWENPRETGVVFGSVLVVLLAIKYISVISVVGNICLALVTSVMGFRIYHSALAAINKTKGGHPFKPLLDKDISISEETALDYTLCFFEKFNVLVMKFQKIFLFDDIIETAKFAILMYFMTYVGAFINIGTILIVIWFAIFSTPRIYRDNQKQIDEALKPFLLKVNELTSLIRSFTGKKKEQ
ncbi:reticulon-1-A [Lepeophtheirus salmonis]|uniref:Reticulon-like protein n=1 Tax=Lepeophtheirus salmonis TaxID=72036 RepID=A0A0K2UPI5_LEPSM|nr:reticulon-1-A-like [Lepeophtheirus salmonis]